jgi:signal transduction histidine kinase
VHNEGKPIPTEEQAALFRPFGRAARAVASGQRGWGLGLTLVKGVAEAHGGEVHLESEPGRGTTFTVALPLDARPFQSHPAEGAAAPPG